MTTGGWIMMAVLVGGMTGLLGWCVSRVLSEPQALRGCTARRILIPVIARSSAQPALDNRGLPSQSHILLILRMGLTRSRNAPRRDQIAGCSVAAGWAVTRICGVACDGASDDDSALVMSDASSAGCGSRCGGDSS